MVKIWWTKLWEAQFRKILRVLMNLWEMLMNFFRLHMCVMDVRLEWKNTIMWRFRPSPVVFSASQRNEWRCPHKTSSGCRLIEATFEAFLGLITVRPISIFLITVLLTPDWTGNTWSASSRHDSHKLYLFIKTLLSSALNEQSIIASVTHYLGEECAGPVLPHKRLCFCEELCKFVHMPSTFYKENWQRFHWNPNITSYCGGTVRWQSSYALP